MGNACCGAGDAELRRRLALLRAGAAFSRRTALLGVLQRSERGLLRLDGAAARLLWTPLVGAGEVQELPLRRVARVSPAGACELVLLGAGGEKLLELAAETQATRDLWAQTLEELCDQGEADADELARREDKRKERHWRERSAELEQRRQDAEARKQKLGLTGMKYTAQAMARR